MLDRGELYGYRVVVLTRVSDKYGSSGSSYDRQHSSLESEISELDKEYPVQIVKRYTLGESAATMDRDSLDEILEMAKNDEFDILMVWAIHRLTRANPWDTYEYLLKLREHDIIIYSDKQGYYDWEDPNDADNLSDRISTSKEWRDEIDRGTRESNHVHLMEGRYPYGTPPYGLYKEEIETAEDEEDDHELLVRDGYEWVPEEGYSARLDGMDEEEISNHIESMIEEQNLDIDPPTKHQVENFLQNELYVGKLVLKRTGELVREKEDLKCVDPELFVAVQELYRDEADGSSTNNNFGPHDFPEFVYKLIVRYGQEYVVDNISAIRWCCPKCGSIDINISDTQVEFWDINLPKIYCNESHCEYNGPPIRFNELEDIDTTLPLVCPECQRTSRFEVEPSDVDLGEDEFYRYTCKHCGEFMIKNKPPDAVKRAMNNPNKAIDLRENSSRSTNTADDRPAEGESNSKNQTEISSFT